MTSDSISLTLGHGNNGTGYSIPEDLKIKHKRVAKIKKAKAALEEREKKENPSKERYPLHR